MNRQIRITIHEEGGATVSTEHTSFGVSTDEEIIPIAEKMIEKQREIIKQEKEALNKREKSTDEK